MGTSRCRTTPRFAQTTLLSGQTPRQSARTTRQVVQTTWLFVGTARQFVRTSRLFGQLHDSLPRLHDSLCTLHGFCAGYTAFRAHYTVKGGQTVVKRGVTVMETGASFGVSLTALLPEEAEERDHRQQAIDEARQARDFSAEAFRDAAVRVPKIIEGRLDPESGVIDDLARFTPSGRFFCGADSSYHFQGCPQPPCPARVNSIG